jgi:hypothetical protein
MVVGFEDMPSLPTRSMQGALFEVLPYTEVLMELKRSGKGMSLHL